MDVKQINKVWGDNMIKALTVQEAAIVFCMGITKAGNIKTCVTTDMSPHQHKEALEKGISILQEQLNNLK